MSIKFLDVKEAAKEYLKTDYFQQMNYVELIYRLDSLRLSHNPGDDCYTLRNKIMYYYTSLVTDFTEYEKNVIRFYFKHLFNLLWKKAPGLIPKSKRIGLIKLNEGVDWNYPYTINHSIILPTIFITSLIDIYRQFEDQISRTPIEVWNPTRPPYDSIDQKTLVLCHELIHILQRNQHLYPGHATIFNFIYTNIWGFKRINKSQIKFSHFNEENFFNVITNPDGYNYEWVIPVYNHDTNHDHWFLPLLSRGLDNKPIGILVEVMEKPHGNYLVTKHWNYVNDIKRYAVKFYGLEKQLYHPNEISAHLISYYVILDHIYSNTQDTIDYYKFYRFINKYLISSNFTPFRDK